MLMILQPIARTFDLDEAVALLVRPELDQIGQTRVVLAQVIEDPPEQQLQM